MENLTSEMDSFLNESKSAESIGNSDDASQTTTVEAENVQSNNVSANDEQEQQISFEDAAKLDVISDVPAFKIVESVRGGETSFTVNNNVKRIVKTYQASDGQPFKLHLTVQSRFLSQGGHIGSSDVEGEARDSFEDTPNKTPVTLVLANGSQLPGYVSKALSKTGSKLSKKTYYFPRRIAEKVIPLPAHGQVLELQVVKILVG